MNGTTRKHLRRKLPVHLFVNNKLYQLIDFSLGGAGANYEDENPPEPGKQIKVTLIFPYNKKNVGWEVTADVVRVDKEKKFIAFKFIEDDDFKAFSLAFYDEMRKKGMM